MTTDLVTARGAIEALRSGVPSRHAVAQLGTTQYAVKDAFDAALEALGAGQGTSPLIVAANFGAGKSHLLEYFQSLAERGNYVTAYLVVSPEMPMGNAHTVLKAIAESARPPGRTGHALDELSTNLRGSTDGLADLRLWARDAPIQDRFRALLHLYEAFRADEDLLYQIREDLEGKPLGKTVIRQRLKEIGQAAAYDLTAPRNVLMAHDRIRVMARFFKACGCKGLVVFFDELERIANFSTKQRLAAYHEVGWWRSIAEDPDSGILPVFTMTNALVENTIRGGRSDETLFGQDAPDAGAEERAAFGRLGIEALTRKPHRLESPSREQEEEVKYRIKAIYERAYGVSVPVLPEERSAVSLSIRREIRRWITLWDLHRYYPDYAADLESGEVEFDTHEITDTEIPHDEDAPHDEEPSHNESLPEHP